MKGKLAILSSPLLLEDGVFERATLTHQEAMEMVKNSTVEVFTNHQTVKILGLEPAKDRGSCMGYETALVLQPAKRLEFSREYTVEEVEEIGVNYILIIKLMEKNYE